MPTKICLDFKALPAPTVLPLQFTFAGFQFSFPLGGNPPAVTTNGGATKALQFNDQGLKIKLPVPSTKVELSVGEYATPVTVTAIGKNNAVLSTKNTSNHNAYNAITHLSSLKKL